MEKQLAEKEIEVNECKIQFNEQVFNCPLILQVDLLIRNTLEIQFTAKFESWMTFCSVCKTFKS